MPELPEVEVTRLGISSHLLKQKITEVVIRNRKMRWDIPTTFRKNTINQIIHKIDRRGKYLLFYLDQGHILIHLGMSGSLRIVKPTTPVTKHDHVDIIFLTKNILRLHDPRRFGAIIYTKKNPLQHKLLKNLGQEPLNTQFDGSWLYQRSKNSRQAIKTFIMDNKNIVGVGNIYANESLFLANIHPKRKACNISLKRYQRLADTIKTVLTRAIAQGGTTLKDFVDTDGRHGYFQQQLNVYGRGGQPCYQCQGIVKTYKSAQRTTFYCANCQK